MSSIIKVPEYIIALNLAHQSLIQALPPSVRMVVASNFLLRIERAFRNHNETLFRGAQQAVVEKMMSPGNTPVPSKN